MIAKTTRSWTFKNHKQDKTNDVQKYKHEKYIRNYKQGFKYEHSENTWLLKINNAKLQMIEMR